MKHPGRHGRLRQRKARQGSGPSQRSQSNPAGTGLASSEVQRIGIKGARLAIGIDLLELADAAVADQFAGQAELAAVFGALLHARLVDAAVALAGLDQGAPLAHGDGDGLLAIHILAGPHGHRGHRGRPVIGQRHQHGVDVRPGEDLAKIVVGLDAVVARPGRASRHRPRCSAPGRGRGAPFAHRIPPAPARLCARRSRRAHKSTRRPAGGRCPGRPGR